MFASPLQDGWSVQSLQCYPKQDSLFTSEDVQHSSSSIQTQVSPLVDSLFDLTIEESDGQDKIARELKHSLLGLIQADALELPREFEEAVAEHDGSLDVWTLDDTEPVEEATPKLTTWEAFEKLPGPDGYVFAGLPGTDASASNTTLASKDLSLGVLPQDITLRALCNLALGRPSEFFHWNAGRERFEPRFPDVPHSGRSLLCSQGVAMELAEYGALVRNLQIYACTQDTRRNALATIAAFKRCARAILDAVEANLTAQMRTMRSISQLLLAIESPRQLLHWCARLRDTLVSTRTDEDAIGCVSDQVSVLVEANTSFVGVLRELLAYTCRPWLNSLLRDVGLGVDAFAIEPHGADDEHEDQPVLTSSTDSAKGPVGSRTHILDQDDRRLITESRRTFKLLRAHYPEELTQLISTLQPENGLAAVRQTSEDMISSTYDASSDTSEAPDAQMALRSLSLVLRDLEREVESALQGRKKTADCSISPASLKPYRRPFDCIRRSVEKHAARMDAVVLRQLFTRCRLLDHLALQYDFHLMGDGRFVQRLMSALFSDEVQIMDHGQGNMSTNRAMELRRRVGQERRWPPASSKLRLTLMDVLRETHHRNTSATSSHSKPGGLASGISFAIREPPDDEIEQALNADSLYALDFLRLQYVAPPPLDVVLTPRIIQTYENIFQYLLRMLRVLYEVKAIRAVLLTAGEHPDTAPRLRLSGLAQHTMTSMMAYVMDIAVAAPWNVFLLNVRQVERGCLHEETVGRPSSLAGLRAMHEKCLDRIRARLFITKKQDVIGTAMEDVLKEVLASVAAIADSYSTKLCVAAESRLITTITRLVDLLQDAMDAQPKSTAGSDGVDDDVGTAEILLSKLNWNGYYAEKRTAPS